MSLSTFSAATRRRMRARRDVRDFDRALRLASPAMQSELTVLAQRQSTLR